MAAPRDPNDTARRVIDVQLAMPAETMAVMNQLVQQMGAMSAQMAAMSSPDPHIRAQATKHLAVAATPGSVPAGSGGFASTPTEGQPHVMGPSEGASTAYPVLGQVATSVNAARRDAQHALATGTPVPDSSGAGASMPPNADPGRLGQMFTKLTAGRTAMQGFVDRRAAGIEDSTGIPADKTNHFVNTMTQGLLGRNPDGETTDHHALVDVARTGAITYAMNKANQIRGEADSITQGQDRGISTGFDRPGQVNIPGTDIGIINPLDLFKQNSAFRETINQRVNIARLRAKGGINKDQANGIVNSVAGLGWGGETGQNMEFNQIAPLVQQGLDPGLTAQMFDQAARNGVTPLNQLKDTLTNLGSAAAAAHMSLTEYQKALDDFANQLQQRGATYGEGVQIGKDLSSSLGMSPQQVGQLAGSPLTLAMTSAQYGILPQAAGSLDATHQAASIGNAADMAMRAFGGLPAPVDPKTGKPLMSAKRYQTTMAAQMMGVSYETMQHYLDARPMAATVQKGNTAADKFGSLSSQYKSNLGKGMDLDSNTARLERVQVGQSWDQTVQAMTQSAGLDKNTTERTNLMKQIGKIKDEDNPTQQVKDAKRFLSDASKRMIDQKTNADTVKVEFTGAAAKYFKQSNDKLSSAFRDSDNGGRPRSESVIADSAVDIAKWLANAAIGG